MQPKRLSESARKHFPVEPGNIRGIYLSGIFHFIGYFITIEQPVAACFNKLPSGSYNKLVLLVLSSLLFNSLSSQENYVPGTVINANGDTIAGLIDYQGWKKNPRTVRFKKTANEAYVVYTPIDIVEFSVLHEIYVGGVVESEISSLDAGDLMQDPDPNIKTDTVFLQTLIKGNKCLYLFKNIDGRDNFYIKNDSKIELLLYKKYLKTTEGKSVVKELKRYVGQLLLYLADCPALQLEIEKASYDRRSLTKIFQNYYKCSGDQMLFEKKSEKMKLEVGVLAGATITTLGFRSQSREFMTLTNTNYNHSIRFTAGLRFELLLPRNRRKWSINNELLFTSYEAAGQYLDFESDDKYSLTTTKFGYSHIKILNMVRYTHPLRKMRLFINGGISNSYSVSSTNYSKKETKFFTINSTEIGKGLSVSRTYEQGLVFGVGTKRAKFSAEFRYERGNGISAYPALNSRTNRYYLLFGYGF